LRFDLVRRHGHKRQALLEIALFAADDLDGFLAPWYIRDAGRRVDRCHDDTVARDSAARTRRIGPQQ
jgi:hypothetical protein